jgi:hypothetical protein
MNPSSDEFQRLLRQLGEVGRDEMSRSPGLAAAVDQHTAAVRDVITASGAAVHAGTLLGYLDGFTEVALERGWRPDVDGDFDWESQRVLAVSLMLRRMVTDRTTDSAGR